MSVEEQKTQTPPAAAGAADAAPKEPKEPKEVILGEDGKPLSKGELKKRAKEAESESGCPLVKYVVVNDFVDGLMVYSGVCALQ